MSDVRKTLQQLIKELDEHRHMEGKRYRHLKTGDGYILLFFSFDESTNEKEAVYCFAHFPRVKFHCPIDHFLEAFEQDHG